MITEVDRAYGFDENDVKESQESFDEIMGMQDELEYYKSHVKNRDTLNSAAARLELLAQAIRDENKELFDELTYDADGAYCQGVGIVANVDLDEVHDIIFRSM